MRVLLNEGGFPEMRSRRLRRSCLKALRREGAPRRTVVSVTAVGEEEMEELNRRYLGREGPTDVLAFPMGEESEEGYLLGDVVVCPPYVAAHREDYGMEPGRELELVTVHGILHLLGYDDSDELGEEAMRRRAMEIVGKGAMAQLRTADGGKGNGRPAHAARLPLPAVGEGETRR